MIFNKDAIFPYPILSPYSYDYRDCKFTFNLDLIEESDKYKFIFEIELTSSFIRSLISQKKARYIAIINSVDNKIYELTENEVYIQKNKVILSKQTTIQVYIVANTRFSMLNNYELQPFYDNSKKDIYIKKHTAIAISNVIKFDGEIKKPFQLFKYAYSPLIDSELEVKIDKATEFIEIKFRDESYSFNEFGRMKNYLMYPYVYIGLQRVLTQMIIELSTDDYSFNIEDIVVPDDVLFRKIYNYLKIKKVNEVSIEKLDFVIEQISDDIIFKYTKTVGDLRNEN